MIYFFLALLLVGGLISFGQLGKKGFAVRHQKRFDRHPLPGSDARGGRKAGDRTDRA
ncbi:MAG: hypothetical protein ACLR8Y_01670 [Alistipes indistinctus]